MGVAHAAKFGVGCGGFCAVALADKLDDTRAGVDAAAEHRAQVAFLRAEDVLPLGLVAEEGKRVRDELARGL